MLRRLFKKNNPQNPYDSNYASPKPTTIDTPDYFSWKDYMGSDWTTPAKNQGSCGSCWAFAALDVLESVININEGCAVLDQDLSEQYVLSCLPDAAITLGRGCWGGDEYLAFKYIKETTLQGNYHNGIIPESCFPYRAIDADGCDAFSCDFEPVLCDEKCENWEDFLIPISDYGMWLPDGSPEDREAIKTQIMQTVSCCNTLVWYLLCVHLL